MILAIRAIPSTSMSLGTGADSGCACHIPTHCTLSLVRSRFSTAAASTRLHTTHKTIERGQLEGFQRTRGVLRTFAPALRDAERWDTSPLIGPNVFLGESGRTVSEGARELTTVAAIEEHEGRKQDWNAGGGQPHS